MKRWKVYDALDVETEVVEATDCDSLLAVLRRCVEALEPYVDTEDIPGTYNEARANPAMKAVAAAREILDKEATK